MRTPTVDSSCHLERLLDNDFAEHLHVASATRTAVARDVAALTRMCAQALASGHKLLLFGNGGSAADAQHIAAELAVRFRTDRPALAALALTTDSSVLTAAGNDLGFERIFERQIEALGQSGDIAIGISTSGNSPNVLRALERARAMGLGAAALAGRDGGLLKNVAEPLIVVPSASTARIQEMHILIGHALCGGLEAALGLVPS